MSNGHSKQKNQKAPVRQAPGHQLGFNNRMLGMSLHWGYWVSLVSNFTPIGDWWVKLIVFALNLAALATLYGLSYWRK